MYFLQVFDTPIVHNFKFYYCSDTNELNNNELIYSYQSLLKLDYQLQIMIKSSFSYFKKTESKTNLLQKVFQAVCKIPTFVRWNYLKTKNTYYILAFC